MTNIDNDNDKLSTPAPQKRAADPQDLWAFMPLVVMLVITLIIVLERT